MRERLHVLVGTQVREAVADRARRHRLQPQPAHRLLGLGVLDDEPEDQLAFASRVTGVDEFADILAPQKLVEQLEPVFALGDRLQRELLRDHGQMGEAPFAALGIVFGEDFDQMADRRRQNVFVRLEITFVLGETTQGLRDVVRDGRLFGNDQGFG